MSVRGRVQVSVLGSPEMLKHIAAAGERGIAAAGAGLFAAGNVIMEEAKRRSPVDFGTLADSGYVTLPERSGSNVTVEVGFGGPADDYAVVQHEDMSFRHPVGQAKYLESAMDDKAGEAQQLMLTEARRALERGITLAQAFPTSPGGS